MTQLICAHCGESRILEDRTVRSPSTQADLLRGVSTCGQCGQKTVFGMTNNAITFYPGKGAYGILSENTPQDIRDIFVDAELCFYGMGLRGAVAVSRACVEAGLSHKEITERTLEKSIDLAVENSVLTATQHMLAHGSRLVGNDALHEATDIALSDVPSVLSAVVGIINHLFD